MNSQKDDKSKDPNATPKPIVLIISFPSLSIPSFFSWLMYSSWGFEVIIGYFC